MYAEGTKVPIERSRAEIEKRLTAAGATGFGFARDDDAHKEVLYFRIGGRQVWIRVGK